METLDGVEVMLPRERAAELAGISQRRLAYWEKTGLVTPSVDTTVSSSVRVRLYDYTQLLELLVIAALREQVSLQHVRDVVAYLRSHHWAVSAVSFSVHGSEIYFQTPDGEWAGGHAPRQIVLWQVLDLKPLRARIKTVSQRREGSIGRMEKRRGAMSSKQLIAGTRVPVASVQRFMDSGADDAEILEAFPQLVHADLREVRGALPA